jgi:hypothetical protein
MWHRVTAVISRRCLQHLSELAQGVGVTVIKTIQTGIVFPNSRARVGVTLENTPYITLARVPIVRPRPAP